MVAKIGFNKRTGSYHLIGVDDATELIVLEDFGELVQGNITNNLPDLTVVEIV